MTCVTALLACIQEMPLSNFGSDVDYPNCLRVFFQSFHKMFLSELLNKTVQ